ncbi:MAG: SulP family inorganic anion transporter [Acidimicrobiales bacterium]
MAGLVLGVESVPDGLASGLLAGVNPVAGLYAYLYGMIGGVLFTSTVFMTVQGTGAMAIIINDVDVASREDPVRSLVTLSIVTGVVMIIAGYLALGRFLRFVSNEVMTGFISAVGINIVLGQLDDFTGYESEGDNRIAKALNLVVNIFEIDLATTVVGIVTVVLIVGLQRTRIGSLGLVVAVAAGSVIAGLFNSAGQDVAQVNDIAEIPRALPFAKAPLLSEIPAMIVPAMSLAFVGLVQGAGVSAGFPNEDGSPSDESQDFVGQGTGNLLSGIFQGTPVGGSMSASAIIVAAGARSRMAMFFAGLTMAILILAFAPVVELIAMPALAGLLIVVGVGTVKVDQMVSVAKTGTTHLVIMTITLILTLIIPLQFAVLVGVGVSVILFVAQQSMGLVTKRLQFRPDGRVEEVDPPIEVPTNDVVILNPYGALFFANAQTLIDQMPAVGPGSGNSVVVLRIRGADDAGVTLIDVLGQYSEGLQSVGSKLVVVTDSDRVVRQMRVTGLLEAMGEDNVYRGTAFLGETTRQAYTDALEWISERKDSARESDSGDPASDDRDPPDVTDGSAGDDSDEDDSPGHD